jgi:hypothetical protein
MLCVELISIVLMNLIRELNHRMLEKIAVFRLDRVTLETVLRLEQIFTKPKLFYIYPQAFL